jgi:hypothetical protein
LEDLSAGLGFFNKVVNKVFLQFEIKVGRLTLTLPSQLGLSKGCDKFLSHLTIYPKMKFKTAALHIEGQHTLVLLAQFSLSRRNLDNFQSPWQGRASQMCRLTLGILLVNTFWNWKLRIQYCCWDVKIWETCCHRLGGPQ